VSASTTRPQARFSPRFSIEVRTSTADDFNIFRLMVLQQRNGRVDRYGQEQEPQILYLFTATQVEKIRGDLRIL
jgi:hypothetical protein